MREITTTVSRTQDQFEAVTNFGSIPGKANVPDNKYSVSLSEVLRAARNHTSRLEDVVSISSFMESALDLFYATETDISYYEAKGISTIFATLRESIIADQKIFYSEGVVIEHFDKQAA